jgi:hypothetical protein
MSVILSETIKGAGMIAGGPYMVGGIFNVEEPQEEILENSIQNMTLNFEDGKIDSPENLENKPIYIMIC